MGRGIAAGKPPRTGGATPERGSWPQGESRGPQWGYSAGARRQGKGRGPQSRVETLSRGTRHQTDADTPSRRHSSRARSGRRRRGGGSRARPIRRSGGHSAGARPQSVAGGVTDCGRRSRAAPIPTDTTSPACATRLRRTSALKRNRAPAFAGARFASRSLKLRNDACLPAYLTSWIFSMSSRVVSR